MTFDAVIQTCISHCRRQLTKLQFLRFKRQETVQWSDRKYLRLGFPASISPLIPRAA